MGALPMLQGDELDLVAAALLCSLEDLSEECRPDSLGLLRDLLRPLLGERRDSRESRVQLVQQAKDAVEVVLLGGPDFHQTGICSCLHWWVIPGHP